MRGIDEQSALHTFSDRRARGECSNPTPIIIPRTRTSRIMGELILELFKELLKLSRHRLTVFQQVLFFNHLTGGQARCHREWISAKRAGVHSGA